MKPKAMKPKKKLLQQNNTSYQLTIQELTHFKPYLEDLRRTYENLQVGEFSSEIFKKVVSSGTLEIEEKFNQDILTQIKSMGITNKIIQDNLTKGNKELLEEFKNALRDLLSFKPDIHLTHRTFGDNHPNLTLKYISFSEGKFFISEEDKENLLEKYFRVYIETEQEHRLYNQLNNLLESYEIVEAELKKVKFKFYLQEDSKYDDLRHRFFEYENGKYKIRPKMIRGAIEHHAKQEQFKKEREEVKQRIN